MSNAQHRASRCVFVGNIPYDATEDQLVHICEEVGPVVTFRLVLDRETGKPKGYGFCEYRDEETALSARRNLQGYEIKGRQLRVDFAENEKGGGGSGDRNREQRQGGQGVQQLAGSNIDFQRQTGSQQLGSTIEANKGGEPPIGPTSTIVAAQFLNGALGGNQQQQYGVSMNRQPIPIANGIAASVGNDPLTSLLVGMSKHQLYDVMVQMKTMIQQTPQQARQILVSNPQLTKALFQVQIMLGMVRAPLMNHAMLPTQQQQQQRGPVPPPMQQPPLPPQPKPIQPSVISSQVQQPNSLQPMTYQPSQVQQQSLLQAPFQHQGDMVQQNSMMSMSYIQQSVPPPPTQPLQQQYQLQQNPCMDGTFGLLSIGQAGIISGSEAMMGPSGISQMGRNMNISQAEQLGGVGLGALMNQQPSPPPNILGKGMHGFVMGVGQPMGSGHQVGVSISSGSSLMGAPLVHDNQSSCGNQNVLLDDVASISAIPQPYMYTQMPIQGQVPQQQFPQMVGELEQQKALLQQVLSLTAEQINSLPLEQRQQVLQLQQALRA